MEAARQGEILYAGRLEVRPGESVVLANGRVLALSVREFRLLVELARRAERIVSREQLYTVAWGAPMRAGDRSVDVYIHKLRDKLEAALPEWRFIHTHIGFGYRFSPESSHAFHNDATAP
jgi:DNA-binding response OmpR family regulator